MTQRIKEDHKDFIDAISGRLRRRLTKLVDTGQIFRLRGKSKEIAITVPRLLQPRFLYGNPKNGNSGIGRGEGNKGDVVRRRGQKGQSGAQAGKESAQGMEVVLDMDEVIKFMQHELELPNLKPKDTDTFEEIKYKYNSLSKTGPRSLRHVQATMKQAMKRLASMGKLDETHEVVGVRKPIRLIVPEDRDFRYRQYNEVKIPSSNAAIIFARDCSASMNTEKCEIVSDVAWWINCWIRKAYDRAETCYFVHDTIAQEVDEDKFFRYRHGGGTVCSSALELIAEQFENRFPPRTWNLYVFYFGDGDNWAEDNGKFIKLLSERFNEHVVNLFGMVQILPYSYQNSLKIDVDNAIKSGTLNKEYTRTFNIGQESSSRPVGWGFSGPQLSDKDRDEFTKKAIIKLLGKVED